MSKKDLNKNIEYVLLVNGDDSAGKSFYVYLIVQVDKYFKLMDDYNKPDLDLENYGKVLAFGEGKPSLDLQKEIEKKYRVSHSLEELAEKFLNQPI